MNKVRHIPITIALVLLSTAIMYPLISGRFIGFGLLELPEAASEEAAVIDMLIDGHIMLQAFLFAIIVAPTLYAIVVFRRREGDETDAPHIHGNTTIEIVWTVVPILLVIGFAIWGVQTYSTVIASEPDEQLIRAQGFKWDWNFVYPELDGQISPSLVIPVGQPVHLELQSTDVIHAFWVPSFRVKQDVGPYNINDPRESFLSEEYDPIPTDYQPAAIRFTPNKRGVYRVRCAEICGTSHSYMLAHVFVLDTDLYEAWLNGDLTLPSDPNLANADPSSDIFYMDELERFLSENNLTYQ